MFYFYHIFQRHRHRTDEEDGNQVLTTTKFAQIRKQKSEKRRILYEQRQNITYMSINAIYSTLMYNYLYVHFNE